MYKFIFFEIFVYLCGSIPFGLIISKLFKKIDIRNYGSHNIGATNVTRIIGKKYGALVLFLDGMKAIFALFVSKILYDSDVYLAITTVTVVIGHCYSIWLKFNGGKGIACILFSLFFLDYRLGFIFIITWLCVYMLYGISSLSALIGILFTTFFSLSISKPYFLMMLFLLLISFYRHKENILRITNGEELKFKK